LVYRFRQAMAGRTAGQSGEEGRDKALKD